MSFIKLLPWLHLSSLNFIISTNSRILFILNKIKFCKNNVKCIATRHASPCISHVINFCSRCTAVSRIIPVTDVIWQRCSDAIYTPESSQPDESGRPAAYSGRPVGLSIAVFWVRSWGIVITEIEIPTPSLTPWLCSYITIINKTFGCFSIRTKKMSKKDNLCTDATLYFMCFRFRS